MTTWQKIKCFIFGWHNWKVIASGYPAHQKKWTLIKHCKKCRSWKTVKGDKHIPLRNLDKYPINNNFLTFDMVYKNRINHYQRKIKESCEQR